LNPTSAMPPGAPVHGLREAITFTNQRSPAWLATRLEDGCEAKERIDGLTAILAEGGDDFERIEQPRILTGCRFDLHRIRAARYDVFLAMDHLENVSGSDLENSLRESLSA
jgi:hypothetical protein